MFPKAVLILAAIGFAVIGVGFLLIPARWAAVVDIALPTPMARTDLRATYGGFVLAIGIFLSVCAMRSEWLRPGLIALALCGAGFAGGRLIGILVERSATRLMLVFLAIEITSIVVAVVALRQLRS